jgi:hypothetical protein
MNVSKYFLIFSIFGFLAGCETTPQNMAMPAVMKMTMSTVMNQCGAKYESNFDNYADCLKYQYETDGTRPNAPTSKAFLAQVAVLKEMYKSNQITNAQATALTYDYYLKTIHAQNEKNSAAADAAFLNTLNLLQQQQQQQQILQQLRAPVQTTCFKNGQYTNCTSN